MCEYFLIVCILILIYATDPYYADAHSGYLYAALAHLLVNLDSVHVDPDSLHANPDHVNMDPD